MTNTELNVTAKVIAILVFYVLLSVIEWSFLLWKWHIITRIVFVAGLYYVMTKKIGDANERQN